MKILIYKGAFDLVEKSGIGKAILHQETALKNNNIECTTNKEDDYDILQLNTVFLESVMMAKKAKKAGKKIVYYGHSTAEDFKNSFWFSNMIVSLFRFWMLYCYRHGDVIITPTEYSKALLIKEGIKQPIKALSNGVDLTFFKKLEKKPCTIKEKYGFSADDKIIISVGHYIERKGILDFIKLAEQLPEYKFIWFGYTKDSLLSGKVRKALKKKLPNLFFPGYISKEELRDAYNESDLFLFLTHEETEGIVVLEALATKIPILVRDIPIYESWLQENKEVYKARNNEEFAKKIKGILEGELPSLVDNAYEIAKKKDVNLIGNELKEVYEKLLGDGE